MIYFYYLVYTLRFINIFFETKVSSFQNQIFFFTISSRFKLVNYTQYLLIKSLFSHLKLVNETLVFEKKNYFPSERKLQIAFNLRKNLSSSYLFSSYFNNKYGTTYFFKVSDIYRFLNSGLYYLSFIPYAEVFLNRFTINSRPFRLHHDEFVYLKYEVLKTFSKNLYFSFKQFEILDSTFSLFNANLIKRFSLIWKNTNFLLVDSYHFNQPILVDNLFNTILNYSITGLFLTDKFNCY